MRYFSSVIDENIGTVATEYRFATEQGRRQKELEEKVVKLEVELKAAANPVRPDDKASLKRVFRWGQPKSWTAKQTFLEINGR